VRAGLSLGQAATHLVRLRFLMGLLIAAQA
jgi:hypothetical protein